MEKIKRSHIGEDDQGRLLSLGVRGGHAQKQAFELRLER